MASILEQMISDTDLIQGLLYPQANRERQEGPH